MPHMEGIFINGEKAKFSPEDILDSSIPSGFSPTVEVTNITGGHRVSITDANGTKTFDVMDGSGSGGSSASSLSDLSDVSITSPTNGQVLLNNGASWVNRNAPWAEVAEVASANLFDPNSDITLDGILLPWDGSVLSYGGTFYTHIPCESGQYTFLVPKWLYTDNTGRVPLFDSNKSYITETTGTVTEYSDKDSIVTISITQADIENGVAYFGFSETVDLMDTLMVVKSGTYPTNYIPYGTVRTIAGLQISMSQIVDFDPTGNPLSGKVLSANGDSICAGVGNDGVGYADIIASENGMTIDNISVGGATIASGTGAAHCISTSISDMRSDADYILLEGGVNDADMQVPLGTVTEGYTDTLDTATFAGAFESMLKSAVARFPGKKIGFIITHKVSNRWDSRTTNSYYNVAVAACEKWGIPYLDLNAICPPLGYMDALKTAYTNNGDGYHPNADGYNTYYVPKITAWMKTL